MTATFDGLALELRDVTKRFGSKTAVSNLSISVPRGQVVCLLGPNGAGKTTTIEMCEGFLKPTSGDVRVLGLNPAAEPDKLRSRIGIMLQGGGAYSGIRIREMLHLAARYNADPIDPDWLLKTLGLEGVAKTTYRRLSGGQQQRLSLAQAIIGRPELVFLDEPTAGLDAQSRLAVWDLISALRADGVTIVLTTHLMDEAQALADHVIIIDHGELVTKGSPKELIAAGSNSGLTFDTATQVDLAALAKAGVEATNSRPLRYRVAGKPGPEDIAKLTHELARQGVQLQHLDAAHGNLEDIFLELTGRELRS